MNHGRIEQLGSPIDLYESPTTTFVANFLGQSNLLAGRVVQRRDTFGVDVHGQHLEVPGERVQATGDEVLVGVRPEKIRLLVPGSAGSDGSGSVRAYNRLTGGTVTDASFAGVSTQYLVRLPWGQELSVFAQNLDVARRFGPGSRVDLCWEPEHTFGLAGDATAGADVDDGPVVAPAQVG
jgi:spermidine/putrescine transport system ATP-binding protein